MEVKLHFPVNHPADTFHQARRLVVRFTLPFNRFQGRAGKYGESALMDNLISGIQFRDNKVNGCTISQHPMLICILIRAKSRKRGEQPMMKIDNPSGELPACARGEHTHVAGEENVIDLIMVK